MKKSLILFSALLVIFSCKRIRENNVVGYYQGNSFIIGTTYDPFGNVVGVDSVNIGLEISVTSFGSTIELGIWDYEIPLSELKYYKPYSYTESTANSGVEITVEFAPNEYLFHIEETDYLDDGFIRVAEHDFLGFKQY